MDRGFDSQRGHQHNGKRSQARALGVVEERLANSLALPGDRLRVSVVADVAQS